MSKVQISVVVTLDHLQWIQDIKQKYGCNNDSEAVRTIFNQWYEFLKAAIKAKEDITKKKPVNPLVEP